MRSEIAIELLAIDRRSFGRIAFFQFGDILGWRNTAKDLVRAAGKRGLVDNRIKNARLDAALLTPGLGEDVMNVDILGEKDGVVELLPRTKILCCLLHREDR